MKKSVLVTGSAKRIGRRLALDFASDGWDVAVHCNSSIAEAEEVAGLIRGMGCNTVIVRGNLSEADVPEEAKEAELEIYRSQAADKPADVQDKIAEGKLRKWFEEVVLLNQPYFRDEDQTVEQVRAAVDHRPLMYLRTYLEPREGFVWPNPPEVNFVDKHTFAKLKQMSIAPSELAEDYEFVRRAYLDCIGRMPTADEAKAFLADKDAKKRERLVDALVDADIGNIGNVAFEVKDIKAKRDEALEKAAADCRATAARVAGAPDLSRARRGRRAPSRPGCFNAAWPARPSDARTTLRNRHASVRTGRRSRRGPTPFRALSHLRRQRKQGAVDPGGGGGRHLGRALPA